MTEEELFRRGTTTDRIHRAVNIGERPYEEVVIFLMDGPDAVPQPVPGR